MSQLNLQQSPLGIGPADGTVSRDWGPTAPIAGIPAVDWSLRLTGTITFPAPGTYQFHTYADDATQVWIDNFITIGECLDSSSRASHREKNHVPLYADQLKIGRLFWCVRAPSRAGIFHRSSTDQ